MIRRARLACLAAVLGIAALPRPGWSQRHHEEGLGQYIDRLVLDDAQLLEVEAVQRLVSEIGKQVVAASGNREGLAYQFRVLNDPVPRAFSAPGGYVYITSGLLALASSRDEVAGVLGHEVAHCSERHQTKFMRIPAKAVFAAVATNFAAQVLANMAANAYGEWAASNAGYYNPWLIQNTANQIASSVVTLVNGMGLIAVNAIYKSYTANDEFTADSLGVDYSRRAGFDGRRLAVILSKVAGYTGQGLSALPGWHRELAADKYPRLNERIQRIEAAARKR